MPIGIYKRTEEHGKKIGDAQRGEQNHFYSEHHTEDTKKRISDVMKVILIGNSHGKGNKGKTRSEEAKQKNREAHLGEKSSSWRGGISFEPYSLDWTATLRLAIRERDSYICRLCSQDGNIVHHIDYAKKNSNSYNLITLCRSCHTKVNFNRTYWESYFNQDP